MRFFPALFFLLFFSPAPLAALEIPQRPEGRISDYAGTFSPSTRSSLEEKLRRFESETSNQIAVVTFPSLEGEVLEDFSIRLAEQWKIGQKGKDNGVILLIFKNDRKVRLEVGYGLEGVLPDATCRLIIENEIAPRFREGRFDEGIEAAVEAVITATKGEYQPETEMEGLDYIGMAVVGFIAGLFLSLAFLWFIFAAGLLFALLGLAIHSYVMTIDSALLGFLPLVTYFLFARHLKGRYVLDRTGYRIFRDTSWAGFDSGGSSGGFGGGGGGFGGGGASGGW